MLEMATNYAKARVRFGRPIGRFQATKHKCADINVDLKLAQAPATYAAIQLAELSDKAPCGGQCRQSLLHWNVPAGEQRTQPVSRRRRVHLGALRALVPPARQN
jgi:alkylation response protein AidB-like acyl-CoA dehydrogenase